MLLLCNAMYTYLKFCHSLHNFDKNVYSYCKININSISYYQDNTIFTTPVSSQLFKLTDTPIYVAHTMSGRDDWLRHVIA